MVEMFLPSGLICTFFVLLWIIRYPSEFLDSLLFQDTVVYGLLSWVFLGGFVCTVVFLAGLIVQVS